MLFKAFIRKQVDRKFNFNIKCRESQAARKSIVSHVVKMILTLIMNETFDLCKVHNEYEIKRRVSRKSNQIATREQKQNKKIRKK